MTFKNEIEGEWGDFVIKLVDQSDIPAIQENLKENFYKDEPTISLCPLYEDNLADFADFAVTRVATILEKHAYLCLIAISKSTNEIAGCQLQYKLTKEEAETGQPTRFVISDQELPHISNILNQIIAVPLDKPKIDLFYRFGVDALAWNFISSTTKKFRGQGLASEMYRRMLTLLRAENFKLVGSLFTSPFSRRCAQKLGFHETARINFEFAVDEDGNKILPKSGKDDFGNLMVREL